ncbi:MAG TPA: M42 family metallopeptidase [Thermomicrobiales bacterium]|nr:M42 family metallopeptidase [Thermomicrobiales bacterium]
MDEQRLDFLKRLVDAAGPSGFEQEPAAVWREEAALFADEVARDVLGNSVARLRADAGPKVIIEGHIDEIGLLVTHVDEQGFLWFETIGGWDEQVLPGQRVRIRSEQRTVRGVIGRKAAHIVRRQGSNEAVKARELWIDIGASDRADAQARVTVGDPVVIDSGFLQLTGDLCVSRAMDNRVGAFVALEATRLLAEDRPRADVYAVAAAQEEISFAGASTASFQIGASLAIAIDVTHATDYPEADKKSDGEVKLGGGPVLTRGASINPVVFSGLRQTARDLGLDCPIQGAAKSSGTDADAMVRSGPGTPSGLVSIPNRYMHSPNEMVSLSDLESAAKLIAAYVRTITDETDFRP